jgi:hypothetical protein
MISRRDCLVRIAVLLLAPFDLFGASEAPQEPVLCDEAGFPLVTETGELIGC